MLWNISSLHGEKGTGYEDGAKGPFRCDNCHYFRDSNSSCGQKDMVAKSKHPVVDGRIEVEPAGCCDYIERMGKTSTLRKAWGRKK